MKFLLHKRFYEEHDFVNDWHGVDHVNSFQTYGIRFLNKHEELLKQSQVEPGEVTQLDAGHVEQDEVALSWAG